MPKFAVILAAAGQSSRFRDGSNRFGNPLTKKVFATLAGRPLWMFAAEAFSKRSDVVQMVLVIAPDDKDFFNEKFSGNVAMLGVQPVLGGERRADSVLKGLEQLRSDIDFVAIHDAARPCISETLIDAVFAAAEKTGAAILAEPCQATLKRVDSGRCITETVPRQDLWLAQTPQVFRKQLLLDAYAAHPEPGTATDEASIVEAFGHRVSVVESSPLNIKVTKQADLKFAELALKALPKARPFPFG